MKELFFVPIVVLALCVSPLLAAEANYPPPPQPGQPISVEDTVYGVLRTHRNLRGMQENREVLEHEVRRAQAGFGPRAAELATFAVTVSLLVWKRHAYHYV